MVVTAVPCWATMDDVLTNIKQGECSKASSEFRQIETSLQNNTALGAMKDVLLAGNYLSIARDAHASDQCFDEGMSACDSCLGLTGIDQGFKSLAYVMRGNLWESKGDYDQAMADYRKSVDLSSSNVVALDALALRLATYPDQYRDGKKAVEYAEKLIKLAKEENASYFVTLAAAYAEVGNFPEAIKAQEKAISLEKTPPLAEEQLASYKESKPWRIKPVVK